MIRSPRPGTNRIFTPKLQCPITYKVISSIVTRKIVTGLGCGERERRQQEERGREEEKTRKRMSREWNGAFYLFIFTRKNSDMTS